MAATTRPRTTPRSRMLKPTGGSADCAAIDAQIEAVLQEALRTGDPQPLMDVLEGLTEPDPVRRQAIATKLARVLAQLLQHYPPRPRLDS